MKPLDEAGLLLVVADAYQITGRGCLLTPGVPTTAKVEFRVGDAVRLIRPNGEVLDSVIKSIDAVHNRRAAAPEINFFVVLPKTIATGDVPMGTRVVLNKAT
jgi:hypothetical protein